MRGKWQHFQITHDQFVNNVQSYLIPGEDYSSKVFFTGNLPEENNITYLITLNNILNYSSKQLDDFINLYQWIFESD